MYVFMHVYIHASRRREHTVSFSYANRPVMGDMECMRIDLETGYATAFAYVYWRI